MKEMICEHCGRTFHNEYYRGGYIDHYKNFASNKFGKDLEKDLHNICFHGNEVRDDYDIKNRLDCYLKHKEVPDEMKELVKEKCEKLFCKIELARTKAKNIVKDMTSLEKKYLISACGGGFGTVYGNEDKKIWD